MCTPYKLEKVENRGTPYKREGRKYAIKPYNERGVVGPLSL
jgi:hypothetical protein